MYYNEYDYEWTLGDYETCTDPWAPTYGEYECGLSADSPSFGEYECGVDYDISDM